MRQFSRGGKGDGSRTWSGSGLASMDEVNPSVASIGVRVLLFGVLREQLGGEVVVAEPVDTIADLWLRITRDRPHLRDHRDSVRAARNLAYCPWDTPVRTGDEVAFLPPVSGGAPGDAMTPRLHVAVTDEPIDIGRLHATTRSDGDGAVASFLGVVRDHHDDRPVLRLDYEAYVPMAELEMQRIAEVVCDRHRLGGLALVHRVGSLDIGEVSVAVVAAAAHRAAALEGCHDAIEMIKRELPIWKREHHPEGAHWVDARHLDGGHG